MKKLITLCLGLYSFLLSMYGLPGCCEGSWASNLMLKGSVGYESEYVYRGMKTAQEVILPEVEMAYCTECWKAYVGGWGVVPVENSNFKTVRQANPYIGATFNLTDIFYLDVGYTYYWYLNNQGYQFLRHNVNRQNEIHAAIIGDVILSPAFRVFYNWNLNQWVIQGDLKHSFDLFCLTGLRGLCLDFYFDAAWVHASKFNGDQRPPGVPKHHNRYWFFDVKFDLTYWFCQYISLSVGPRFTYNTDGLSPWYATTTQGYSANVLGNHHHMLWWGARIGFQF